MKIKLLKAVTGTGRAGEVVEVKDAYARNFLLPKRLAQVATVTVLQTVAVNAERRRRQVQRTAADLVQARDTLSQVKITLSAESSSQGRLFAAVHSVHLVQKIEQQCHIKLTGVKFKPDHWKTTGQHRVEVIWPDNQKTNLEFEIAHA